MNDTIGTKENDNHLKLFEIAVIENAFIESRKSLDDEQKRVAKKFHEKILLKIIPKKGMNETEINDDNCFLEFLELEYLAKAIEIFLRKDALNHEEFHQLRASKIFKKIQKLNDLVKQAQGKTNE